MATDVTKDWNEWIANKPEYQRNWRLNRNHHCQAVETAFGDDQQPPCGRDLVKCPRCATWADTCETHLAEVGPIDNAQYVCWNCAADIENKFGAGAPILEDWCK